MNKASQMVLLISALAAIPIQALADHPARRVLPAPIVAATPPMGWNPWNAFRTDVDEARVLQAANAMVRLGLAKAGYRYVNIDDAWAIRREADGTLTVRTSTFPSARLSNGRTSFRPFVERLHAMGLKAGIYSDIGRNTCSQVWDAGKSNLPEGSRAEREVGTLGFGRQDAALFFGRWGFDYIKVDACGLADYSPDAKLVRNGSFRPLSPLIVRGRPALSDRAAVERLYADFVHKVRAASPAPGPVIAICAWGEADVADWAGRYASLWRTSPDLWRTWKDMLRNFDSAAPRALFAGPGRWNDPDMLEVGNGEFDAAHLTEARTHMSLWAIIAAPLILSFDLTKAAPEILDIVRNPEVIAIDQDPAGNQGVILTRDGDVETVVKTLADGSKALLVVNRGDQPVEHVVQIADLRYDPAAPITARDVWHHAAHPVVGGVIRARLGRRETLLLRVSGRPVDPLVRHLDEMPARVRLITEGYKPADRSLQRPWVPVRLGYLPSGGRIFSDGTHDHDALALASGGRAAIALNGQFRRFRARPAQPGRFAIYGDGRLLFHGNAAMLPLDLPVAGVQSLEMQAPADMGQTSFVWNHVSLHR